MANIINLLSETMRQRKCERLFERIIAEKKDIEIKEKDYKQLANWLSNKTAISYSTDFSERYSNKDFVHIKNEILSKSLYKLFINNKDREFKIVTISKEEKVAFIYCSESSKMDLSCLYEQLQGLTCALSTDEQKIDVDYYHLLKQYDSHMNNFILCLFNSLVLGEYELSIVNLQKIISHILSYNFYISDYEQIEKNFYLDARHSYILHGIFRSVDRQFDELPIFIEMNIYRLIAAKKEKRNCFDNNKEFFKNCLENISASIEEQDIIFDEKLFLSELQCIEDNATYAVYKENWIFHIPHKHQQYYSGYFMCIKDQNMFMHISNLINNNDLVLEGKLLYTSQGNVYANWNEYSIDNLNKILTNVDVISATIVSRLSKYKYLKDKLFVKKGANILDFVCYNNERGIYLTNLHKFSFEKEQDNEPIDFVNILMQYIKKYLQDYPNVNKNYIISSLIKILPPSFINELENYLSTNQFNLEKTTKGLIITTDLTYSNKIRVINGTTNYSSISVLNNVSEEVNKYAKQRDLSLDKTNGKYGEYISQDYLAQNRFGKEIVNLTSKNLKKFLDKSYDKFMVGAEEVVVSKEIYSNGRYKVIGVVLNTPPLYSLYDLLKNNILNLKEIYMILFKLLEIHQNSGYALLKGSGDATLKNVYVSDTLDVYFGSYTCIKIAGISSRANYCKYIVQIIESAGIHLENRMISFELFNKVTSLQSLKKKISQMDRCSKHGEWHFHNELCPECIKTYVLQDSIKILPSGHGEFGSTSKNELVYIGSINEDIIKQGLLNQLYNKFCGIVPKKILVKYGYLNEILVEGVLYEAFNYSGSLELKDFKQLQRLKVVLTLESQLLPLINSGDFVCESDAIFSSMIMHKEYKGKVIFPDILKLECDVILSTDTKLKNEKKQKTLKAFYDFLYKYISEDEYLKLDNNIIPKILNDLKNQKIDVNLIKKYLYNKTNYCQVHKMNFDDANIICPLCEADGILDSRTIIEDNGYFTKLEERNSEYEGGEANLYPYGENQIQKIFNSSVNISFKSKIIGKAIAKQPLFDKFNEEHSDVQFVTIDKVLYSFDGETLKLKGYTQNFIKNSYKISCLKDKNFVTEKFLTKQDIVDILIKVCVGIEYLHSIGCFIGDLNGGNILIKDKTVYFIDFDGMSMDEVINSVYTNMYIYPPSAETKSITKKDDWYSLAVQAFYYLTYSHPFRGVSNYTTVPNNEVERMKCRKSLLGNHGIRPPSICEGWNTMPKELVRHFYDTFEGDKRSNMLELLVSYKIELQKDNLVFKQISRLNPAMTTLSEDIYIDTLNNLLFKEKVILPKVDQLKRLSNEWLIWSEDNTYILKQDGSLFSCNKSYNFADVLDICDGQIFYKTEVPGEVLVDTFSNNVLKILHMNTGTNYEILGLKVLRPNVVLFVEYSSKSSTMRLRWNSMTLARLNLDKSDYTNFDVSFAMDETTGNCIIAMYKNEILISAYCVIEKSMVVNTLKVCMNSKFDFYKNVVYWTDSGKIFSYNVISEKLKVIDCEVAKKSSDIQRSGNSFFIGNKTESFVYVKS